MSQNILDFYRQLEADGKFNQKEATNYILSIFSTEEIMASLQETTGVVSAQLAPKENIYPNFCTDTFWEFFKTRVIPQCIELRTSPRNGLICVLPSWHPLSEKWVCYVISQIDKTRLQECVMLYIDIYAKKSIKNRILLDNIFQALMELSWKKNGLQIISDSESIELKVLAYKRLISQRNKDDFYFALSHHFVSIKKHI